MKNLIVFSTCFFLFSCSKFGANPSNTETAECPSVNSQPSVKFNYGMTTFTEAKNAMFTVKILANKAWKISLPAAASWLSIDKLSGEGCSDIILSTTTENYTGNMRIANVKAFLTSDTSVFNILVVQQQDSSSHK